MPRTTEISLILSVALFSMIGLSGCGKSKQNAALALDEARLTVASAKSADAQTYAPEPLQAAEAALRKAEDAFRGLHYESARTEAEKAVMFAKEAQTDAEKKAAELKKQKTAKNPVKRTAKRKAR